MVFPDDALQVKMEIALGADINGDPSLWSWTDISDFVRTADGAKVVVRFGRRNDSGSTPPATASFDLNNGDGRFCTQLPTSPYFPLLQVNTPVKISVSTDSGGSWSVRFSGFLSGLPTSWRGAAGSDSWVSVTADSVLRRLDGQPSRSPLQHTAPNLVSGNTGCIEYWPIEDGKAATQAGSYFPGGVPMTAGGSIEMGTSSPPPGSRATAQSDYEFMQANPPSLAGIVRPYTDTGEWSALGIFKTDPGSAANVVLLDSDINHGEGSADPDLLRFVVVADTLSLRAYREDESLLGSYTTAALTPAPNDGEWHAFGVTANQSGADVSFKFRYEGNTYSFTVAGKTLGTIRKVAFPSTTITTQAELLAVGHLAVYDDALADSSIDRYVDAMNAHRTDAGELASDRLQRVKDETDLIYAITELTGGTGMFERLGEQSDGNAMNILQDAVKTDGGILVEQRDFTVSSLKYRARSAINANTLGTPTLTLSQDDFAILGQENDDHYLTTSVTVSGAGSSAVAVQHPIDNETSVSLNPRFPGRLPDMAGWALHQGTRRDYRYPQIRMLLHGAPGKIAEWLVAEPGHLVRIDDPPPGVVDGIDLILEGYQESLDQFSWIVDMYCSPASRYRIAKLDDTTFGRMDTAGSRLITAVSSSATTLEVETTEGPEWTTTAGFDVGVGGERMTVSAIASAFTDTFTRTESNGWGTSDSGHAWSTTGGVAADYSVNGARGLISIGAVSMFRSTYISALSVADIDRTLTVRVPVLATGAGIPVWQAARWNISSGDYIRGGIQVETDQSVTASLGVTSGGALTAAWTKTVPGLTHTTTTDFRVRFRTAGPWMFLKIWTGAEPTQWSLIAYDTQVTAAGAFGYRARLNTGNTNALPVSIQVDADATLNPQKFTVTRSVNDVTKAHSAGDAVGLFQPNYLGL